MFVWAQIVSVLTIAFQIIGLLQKEKKKTLIFLILSNFCVLLTYFLLGHLLASILIVVAIIRTITYFEFSLHNKKPNFYVFLCFEIAFALLVTLFWKDWTDILLLSNIMLVTYITWQDNMKVLRIGYIVSSLIGIVYDSLIGGYVAIICGVVQIFSTIYALIKYHIPKDENKFDSKIKNNDKIIAKNSEQNVADIPNSVPSKIQQTQMDSQDLQKNAVVIVINNHKESKQSNKIKINAKNN